MARVQTIVQLTDELVRQLDQEAARRGTSRSAVIRVAVTECLAGSAEAAVGRKIVEGYTKIPPGTPDEWGDLEALNDALTEETLQRLTEEERRTGSGSW